MSLKKFLKSVNTSGGCNCSWKIAGAATAKLRSPSVRRVFISGGGGGGYSLIWSI